MNELPNAKTVFRGNLFEVVQWSKGENTFELASRAPGVRLLIEIETEGEKCLLMTREMRQELNAWDYRLPGGKVFDSLSEFKESQALNQDIFSLVLRAAQKEGKEEAGIRDGVYEYIGVSKAGSSVEWDLHYFVVRNAAMGKQELEDDEEGNIEVVTLTPKEIFEKLLNGEVQEGRSAEKLWLWLAGNNFIKFS